MNAKALIFIAAIAASANVFAAGRDSVYAQPGVSVGKSAKTASASQGRSSVYAKDLPTPKRASSYAGTTVNQHGRA